MVATMDIRSHDRAMAAQSEEGKLMTKKTCRSPEGLTNAQCWLIEVVASGRQVYLNGEIVRAFWSLSKRKKPLLEASHKIKLTKEGEAVWQKMKERRQ